MRRNMVLVGGAIAIFLGSSELALAKPFMYQRRSSERDPIVEKMKQQEAEAAKQKEDSKEKPRRTGRPGPFYSYTWVSPLQYPRGRFVYFVPGEIKPSPAEVWFDLDRLKQASESPTPDPLHYPSETHLFGVPRPRQ